MNQKEVIKIKNRLKEVLERTEFPNLKPTVKHLNEMQMTSRRFSQLKKNTGEELRYNEAVKLSKWLKPLIEVQPYELYEIH